MYSQFASKTRRSQQPEPSSVACYLTIRKPWRPVHQLLIAVTQDGQTVYEYIASYTQLLLGEGSTS
jgi:hypothetical protein